MIHYHLPTIIKFYRNCEEINFLRFIVESLFNVKLYNLYELFLYENERS